MRARLVALGLLLRVALAPALAQPPASRIKPVGVSILEDYDKGENLDDVDRDFALLHELGITTWRGSFAWDHYEPARGRYDFAWLERFADRAAARGITLRPYVAYTPQWATAGGTDKDAWNDPPRRPADWYAFVYALAAAMARHPNVVSFEIYNDENVPQSTCRRCTATCSRAPTASRSCFSGTSRPRSTWLSR